MKPIIAIVGRPNVGKSTFFNRVTRTRNAIVDNFPGVTRDCHHMNAAWNGVEFTLVDTGGFTGDLKQNFSGEIRTLVQQSIEDADIIILIMDGKTGLITDDYDIAKICRQCEKPIFYVVNKIDGPVQEELMYDFFSLGIEELYPVSSEHGYGIRDFLDSLVLSIPEKNSEYYPDMPKIAVVGRPNAGKSSLINQLIGKNRLLVSDIPGTTRDAIDTICNRGESSYLFIDTAGIRRKGKVKKKLEKFSVIKALKSLERCDIALIVLDASEGITDQDITIAGYAYKRGCGCIFLLNKWDIIKKDSKTEKQYIENLRFSSRFLNFAPALTISALTGLRINRIPKLINKVYAQYCIRVNTGRLNNILKNAIERNEPSLHRGRRIKFFYATQTTAKPPTIVIFVNYPEAVHFSYKRYLINRIREATGLKMTPIRIKLKKRERKVLNFR